MEAALELMSGEEGPDLRALFGTAEPGADRRWQREPTGARGIWRLDRNED